MNNVLPAYFIFKVKVNKNEEYIIDIINSNIFSTFNYNMDYS